MQRGSLVSSGLKTSGTLPRAPIAPQKTAKLHQFCANSSSCSSGQKPLFGVGHRQPLLLQQHSRRLTSRPKARPDGTDEAELAIAADPKSSEYKQNAWLWEESSDAFTTYLTLLAVLGFGLLPYTHTQKILDLPYFISLAVITIYVGAHRGLNAKQRQQINFKEGVLAPFAASISIFAIYTLIKYFPELSLQTFFDAYFWLLACVALIGGFAGPARHIGEKVGLPQWTTTLPTWVEIKDEDGSKMTTGTFAITDIAVIIIGVYLATLDLTSHHSNFTLNNLIACTIASDILQLVGLKSFRVAGVLLVGLLLYDVAWVFGSPLLKVPSIGLVGDNVMMQVATSFSGPTKLLFPRVATTVSDLMREGADFPFSILGLGDIAVPGLLLCLALRFDASRAIDMRTRGMAAAEAMQTAMESLDPDASGDEIAQLIGNAAEDAYNAVADRELEQYNRTQGGGTGSTTVFNPSDAVLQQRPYFNTCVIAYIVGLAVAFAANSVTGLGQPALLYIVPSVLGAVALLGMSRGEFDKVWGYSDTTGNGDGGEGAPLNEN